MAAFDAIDWGRFDVSAIITCGGVVTVEEAERATRREWLLAEGYAIDTLDCSHGRHRTLTELGRMLRWEEKFGYRIENGLAGLDALHDGFEFDIPDGGRRVFEILRADLAWHENAQWMSGLLDIATEHSRAHLALGRRFFTMLVLRREVALSSAWPSWTTTTRG
jgi:hypothetical protein